LNATYTPQSPWFRSEPGAELGAFGPELEGRLRGNDQMLGLTQEMLWQWEGIESFIVNFQADAVSLKERIQEELVGR